MSKNSVDLVLSARDESRFAFTSVDASLVSLEQKLDRIGQRSMQQSAMFNSSIMQMASIGAGYFGISSIVEGISKFGDYERDVLRLAGSLQQIGAGGMNAATGFAKEASELQRLSGISDEAIIKSMALGASLGRLSGQGLTDATKAAIGWATILDRDVNETMLMITKAANGNFTAFQRLGVSFEDCTTPAEKFYKVIQEGNKGFEQTKGLDDTKKKLDELKNSFEETKRAYGRSMMESFNWIPIIAAVRLGLMAYPAYVNRMMGPMQAGGTLPPGKRTENEDVNPELKEEAKNRAKINEIIEKNTEDIYKLKYGEEALLQVRLMSQGISAKEAKEIVDNLTRTKEQITAANELKKMRREILEQEIGKDEIERQIWEHSKNISAKEYIELMRLQDREKAIKENININKLFGNSLEQVKEHLLTISGVSGAGTIYDLIKAGAGFKDIKEMADILKQVDELQKETEHRPAEQNRGWAPVEAGRMMGVIGAQAPTIDYAKQTANNTQKMTDLLGRIETLQQGIAGKYKNNQTIQVEDLTG